MSLRTVADDTLTAGAIWPEPTGWAVSMYSSTTARRMAAFRSSSIGVVPLACTASGLDDVTDPRSAGVAFGRLAAIRNALVGGCIRRTVVLSVQNRRAGITRSDEE